MDQTNENKLYHAYFMSFELLLSGNGWLMISTWYYIWYAQVVMEERPQVQRPPSAPPTQVQKFSHLRQRKQTGPTSPRLRPSETHRPQDTKIEDNLIKTIVIHNQRHIIKVPSSGVLNPFLSPLRALLHLKRDKGCALEDVDEDEQGRGVADGVVVRLEFK
jgi:hypothetical protein